jgi:hypothetical protein
MEVLGWPYVADWVGHVNWKKTGKFSTLLSKIQLIRAMSVDPTFPVNTGESSLMLPSAHVTQMPEIGAGSTLVAVKVAALRFGLLNDRVLFSFTHFFDKKKPNDPHGSVGHRCRHFRVTPL